VIAAINGYLKDISGAQVTPQEADRLFAAFGIPVPASFGAGSDTVTPTTEAQKYLADALKSQLTTHIKNVSPEKIANGINGLLDNTRAAYMRKMAARGGLAGELQQDYEAIKRDAIRMYNDLSGLERLQEDDFGNIMSRVVANFPASRIKGFDDALDIQGTYDKGVVNAFVKSGAEVLLGSPQSQDYNPANPYGNGKQPSGSRVEVKEGETF
jgi:hypothetical protein